MLKSDAAPDEKKLTRPERINQWVVVIAGILGILVTGLSIFGFTQHNAKDQATATADDLQRELYNANRAIGNLRSDNNQLQQDLSAANADNKKLQAANQSLNQQLQAAGASPSATPSSNQSPTPSANVFHSGEVTLAQHGDRIDLNAPPSNPLWEDQDNASYDTAHLENGQLALWGVSVLPLTDKVADYGTCSTSSGF